MARQGLVGRLELQGLPARQEAQVPLGLLVLVVQELQVELVVVLEQAVVLVRVAVLEQAGRLVRVVLAVLAELVERLVVAAHLVRVGLAGVQVLVAQAVPLVQE